MVDSGQPAGGSRTGSHDRNEPRDEKPRDEKPRDEQPGDEKERTERGVPTPPPDDADAKGRPTDDRLETEAGPGKEQEGKEQD